MNQAIRWMLAFVLVVGGGVCAGGRGKRGFTVTFARGGWDASRWTPLRLPNQPTPRVFEQKDDCIGTREFAREEIKQGLDNVLLMADTGAAEGEFAVTFRIGSPHGTAPGVFLLPTCKGDALVKALAVFVADYTMAVWEVGVDAKSGKTTYKHLVRLARWQDPAARHVLRCRYSARSRMVALQVDDSDVVVLKLPQMTFNSRVGLWGCHGVCDYYRFTFTRAPALPWSGHAAKK